MNKSKVRGLSICLTWLILPAYYTIQFIFVTIQGSTAFFNTIHESHCTISVNFYLYLQYFNKKFSVSAK